MDISRFFYSPLTIALAVISLILGFLSLPSVIKSGVKGYIMLFIALILSYNTMKLLNKPILAMIMFFVSLWFGLFVIKKISPPE